MRSLMLKLLLLFLFCLQKGEGLRVRALTDLRPETMSNQETGSGRLSPTEAEFEPRVRRSRSAPDPDPRCGLRSLLLQVRDLGLGYNSDESVLFRYCGGACPHLRTNHQLALGSLLLSGALPRPPVGERWHDAPCCQPTHHEDMAFLDNAHRWHKVEKLSAAGCSCVG